MRNTLLLVATVMTLACAGPTVPRNAASDPGQTASQRPNRALVLVGREVTSLAGKPLQGRSGSVGGIVMPFNAALDMRDGTGTPIPQLAEALPQLNTDTWCVF